MLREYDKPIPLTPYDTKPIDYNQDSKAGRIIGYNTWQHSYNFLL
jgi:hypothetical protein